MNSQSVIRQKGECQDGGNKKINHAEFSEKTNISQPLIRTRTCAYQGITKARFSVRIRDQEMLVSRKYSPFCLITNEFYSSYCLVLETKVIFLSNTGGGGLKTVLNHDVILCAIWYHLYNFNGYLRFKTIFLP